MFNTIFQQQGNPANNSFMGGTTGMFPQNNGVSYNNVAPAKTSTSTPEEMAIIKSQKKNDFCVSDEELAKFGWDLREGQNLAIEIVDPTTERVRIKYTGEEFNIIVQPVEVLNAYLDGTDNFVKTCAVMDTTDPGDVLKQLLQAWGIVKKLLPVAYANGQKNYSNLCNQMQNMMAQQGYNGTWGNNMFNGAIGAVPNYVVNENGMGAMYNNGMNAVNPQMQQMLQQAAAMGAQQAQQQMVQAANNMGNAFGTPGGVYGNPVTPMGGTMMGNGVNTNPFTQGGAPQAAPTGNTPNLNSIPFPGTAVTQGTPNPAMGGAAPTATTPTSGTVTI
jgi:hypothetical protein